MLTQTFDKRKRKHASVFLDYPWNYAQGNAGSLPLTLGWACQDNWFHWNFQPQSRLIAYRH